MKSPHIVLVVCLLVGLTGCLEIDDGQPEVPPVRGEGLDLDPIFAQHPPVTVRVVNLTSGEGLYVQEDGNSVGPWFAGNGLLVHSVSTNSSHAIAVTTVEEGRLSTRLYDGPYSRARHAGFSSAYEDPGSVYFWVAPMDEAPTVVRRDLALGGEETVIATLSPDFDPMTPWTVSSDGTFIAASVASRSDDTADGTPTSVEVFRMSNGSFGSEELVYSTPGSSPRFVSDSELVFARGGQIYLLDLAEEAVSLLVPSAEGESLHYPVPAGGWLWFQVGIGSKDGTPSETEIRRTSMEVDVVDVVARSDDYFVGRFDVSPDGTMLTMSPLPRG